MLSRYTYLTVSVTAEDLACGWVYLPDDGLERRCKVCPLEHALTRALGEPVMTEGVVAWRLASKIRGDVPASACVQLPEVARTAVKRLDLALPVEPFTFEIERPR